MFLQDPSKYVGMIERFLGSRSRTRQQFLENAVDTTYQEVFVAVEEFLDLFLKMKRKFRRLVEQVDKGTNDLDAIIDDFSALVDQIEEQINPGQAQRMQTYARTLDALENQLFGDKIIQVINLDEELAAKSFFAAVSDFFTNGPEYNHYMRSAVGYAQSTADHLRKADQHPRKIRVELEDLHRFIKDNEDQMLRTWGDISLHHAALTRRLKSS